MTTKQAPAFQYPTNEEGVIEFASVQIVLDHLSAGREGNPHVHVKTTFSTQDEAEALYALLGYYGETSIATNPAFGKMVGEVFGKDFPVYVYHTPVNTQIIMAMDTFLEAINNASLGEGSVFMAVERIVQIVNNFTVERIGGHPEGTRLAPFGFELELPSESPAQDGPGDQSFMHGTNNPE